jgi:predicted HTH transcriptional regulator
MSYLQRIIAEGEHQQQDFKFQITDARKIARSLSAFANTDGGRLLIGVKDNGRIAGVRGLEEMHMVEGAASLYCVPEVNVSFHFHTENGKQVVEALIQPSSNKPHFVKEADGKAVAYFRQGDQNFPAGNVLVKLWRQHTQEPKTIELREKEKMLLNLLHNMPFITARKYAQLANLRLAKAEHLLATFIRWGVVGWRYNGTFFEFYLNDNDGIASK